MTRVTHSRMFAQSKPSPNEIGSTWQLRKNFIERDIEVQEFAELCGSGFAWRSAIFKDNNSRYCKKADVEEATVFGLDFDMCEVDPITICEYADSIGIPANFFYYTFSQNPETIKSIEKSDTSILSTYKYIKVERTLNAKNSNLSSYKNGYNFRVVWVLNKPISKIDYEHLMVSLVEHHFKKFNPDTSIKNADRLWFGGSTGANLLREEPIKTDFLGEFIIAGRMMEGKSAHEAKRIKSDLVEDYADRPAPDKVEVDTDWIAKVAPHCRSLRKWINQEYMSYLERLRLISNVKFLYYSNKRNSVHKEFFSYYQPDNPAWEGQRKQT